MNQQVDISWSRGKAACAGTRLLLCQICLLAGRVNNQRRLGWGEGGPGKLGTIAGKGYRPQPGDTVGSAHPKGGDGHGRSRRCRICAQLVHERRPRLVLAPPMIADSRKIEKRLVVHGSLASLVSSRRPSCSSTDVNRYSRRLTVGQGTDEAPPSRRGPQHKLDSLRISSPMRLIYAINFSKRKVTAPGEKPSPRRRTRTSTLHTHRDETA